MTTEIILNEDKIKGRIYTIRDLQVMFDEDLAELYNVKTKVLNQAVKRNIERFPSNFMFQLTEKEYGILKSQIVTSSLQHGGRRISPYAFTEQGVAMLYRAIDELKDTDLIITEDGLKLTDAGKIARL